MRDKNIEAVIDITNEINRFFLKGPLSVTLTTTIFSFFGFLTISSLFLARRQEKIGSLR
jgi:hypothetical protein